MRTMYEGGGAIRYECDAEPMFMWVETTPTAEELHDLVKLARLAAG